MTEACTLLFVDDEETILEIAQDYFSLKGYPVLTATSGEEAVEILGKEKVDCCFTDIHMPGMDGIDTLRKILKIQPAVKVLLLTGYGSSEISKEGLNSGALDYIAKPVNITSLIQKINEAAGR